MKKYLPLLLLVGCVNGPQDVECFIADKPTAYIDRVSSFNIRAGGVLIIRNYQGKWYYKLAPGEFCRIAKEPLGNRQ